MKRLIIFLSILISVINTYAYDIEIDGLRYNVTSLTELTASFVGVADKYPEEFTIPEKIIYNSRELTVTSISSYAFSKHKELTSLTVPVTIQELPNASFNGCTSLTKLIFNDTSTPIKLGYKEYVSSPGYDGPGQGLFYDCPIEYLYMGRQLNYEESYYGYYGYSPFWKNKTLSTVVCSENVTKIGKNMFSGCSSLANFTFSDNITSIDSDGLKGCCITDGNLPKKLRTIGIGALSDNQFETLVLPENLSSIDAYAFRSCKNIKTIIIKGLGSMGNYCFKGCLNISEIYSYVETPPTFTTDDELSFGHFDNLVFMNAKLYVPENSINSYKTAKGWENFWNISSNSGGNESKKCEIPTIELNDGIICFKSSTPNANFYYSINSPDIKSGVTDSKVNLEALYNISVYAIADGFEKSDIASARIYWIDSRVDDSSNINSIQKRTIAVSSNSGVLSFSGLEEGENVQIYSLNGQMLDNQRVTSGILQIKTNEQIVIAKIGNSTIKVVVK